MEYRIGLDVGGTTLKAGVVDKHYHILARASLPTNSGRNADEMLDDMATVCKQAAERAGLTLADIKAVGAGFPGTCNLDSGEMEYANNLGLSHVFPLTELHTRLRVPVFMENDANAAAFGEYLAGAGQGTKNFLCLTFGTGVGGGAILGGKILRGFNFAGGEFGHTVIVADGEPCACGRRGCYESYASVSALIAQTKAAMEAHPESALWSVAPALDEVDGKTPFVAAKTGDETAKAVLERYFYYVGIGVVNFINIFQPDVLCIGGAVSKEGETLISPIRDQVTAERYSKYAQKQCTICKARLGGDAGIVGAAFLDTL